MLILRNPTDDITTQYYLSLLGEHMINATTPFISPTLDTPLPVESTVTATPHIRKKRGIASPGQTWPQHSTVRISLLNMTEAQKIIVKKGINEWAPHANLHFVFVKGNDGDIRISKDTTGLGSWSMVGTEARNRDASEPTMYINFERPEEARANVLHEFGHALGLLHEHQHPQRTLAFDKAATHAHFKDRNFARHEVEDQILSTLDPDDIITSDYDKHSIMHYYTPESLLVNGEEIPFPLDLSDGDVQFMKTLYPRDDSPAAKFLYTLTQFIVSRP